LSSGAGGASTKGMGDGTGSGQPGSMLATLHPAYFALVMATGIVSIASSLHALPFVPQALFAVNCLAYPLLWAATISRALRYRRAIGSDLSHHGRAVGFFTVVAATCVMGSQCVVVGGAAHVGRWFWFAGIVLYVLLVYAVFTALTVKQDKPPLAEGINGGWLVSVVAAQSVAVLGVQVAPTFEHPDRVLFFALAMWLGGGMLYFWIISLIFYRYTFFPMAPSDLAPPYWINMGAAAISTLAGSMLAGAAAQSPVLASVLPFVRGFTLMWWATATWWIPMLILLGIWRHVLRRFPLRYDPLYWGAVFPLGMYTVATVRVAQVFEVPYLLAIPRVTLFVGLAAWTVAFVGMVVHLARALLTTRRARTT
jgi:tellurite resistance protein TehA-like permease